MTIDHSNVIGLAKPFCTFCHGAGLREIRNGAKEVPCNCIFRAVFRACLNRFRSCAVAQDHIGSVTLEFSRGGDGRRSYSRKREEYIADFCLVARRSLSDLAYKIFNWHFVLGADWKLCCARLKMERGNFFHEVYRIEQQLGRVYCSLEPYALYPLNEYFGGCILRALESGPPSLVAAIG